MHYYPSDLAAALQQRWPQDGAASPPLPAQEVLTQLISTLYQASMLQEEGRSVECHVIFATADHLEAQAVALTGFHLVSFAPLRACNEQEIRRLSPAVQRQSSLLAVRLAADGSLMLWGMLFTHHEWDQLMESPRASPALPPLALMVHVRGPGNLVFYCGNIRVLTLQHGRIDGHGFVQFPSAWSQGRFNENGRLLQYAQLPALVTPVEEELVVLLSHHLQRQALARTRASGHGGMVLLVPTDKVTYLMAPGSILQPKYKVEPGSAGPRYRALLVAIVRRLSELGEVSWAHYCCSQDAALLALDAEVTHFADLLADMTAVDGALVLTKQLQIVGFGVEIKASQTAISSVYRALDMEGRTLQTVPADHGGTRHRAAYRLCLAEPECLAIVVSQDGGVQFVHQDAGKVIFWDQLSD